MATGEESPFAQFLQYYMYRVRYPPINPNKLASEVGISRAAIVNWTHGARPGAPELRLLASKTGIPPIMLLRLAGYLPAQEEAPEVALAPEVLDELEAYADSLLGIPRGLPARPTTKREWLEWINTLPPEELDAIFARMDAFMERVEQDQTEPAPSEETPAADAPQTMRRVTRRPKLVAGAR